MDEIDSLMMYGISIIVFSIFSLRFDILFQSWGESLGLLGFLICTISLVVKFVK
ncbi:hypothetical protein [Natrinema pellirubrum]|uniref:hypothetical protein n=1 Tax=Natrinema pellirubrum TaxID=69525 RepID=UPI0012F82085|nr:hypothetical protein [Natrinema pellirubrum]